ncbi:hypothetical protein [Paraburkholderia sp. RL17-373-BIF-A]|uniref:hypothetical protein n=1 Tax=Paraburkholderia sp. RL17-373-BIF-A TaxID=3031629 RepID=UPI0038B8CE9F
MRPALFLIALFFCGAAAAQTTSQQRCNLLSSTVAATADWRDNGVPIAKAQANVEQVLLQMSASGDDKQKWHDAVTAIYSSTVRSDQIEQKLRNYCQ